MGGRAWTALLLLVLLSGCGGPMLWRETSLNQVSVGMSKDEVLRLYPNQWTTSSGRRRDVEGMEIRPTRRTDNRRLYEVGEVVLNTGSNNVPYWFLFENGRLIQWGRQRDWPAVAKHYKIEFNDSPAAAPR